MVKLIVSEIYYFNPRFEVLIDRIDLFVTKFVKALKISFIEYVLEQFI